MVIEFSDLLLCLCLNVFMEVAEFSYFAHTSFEECYLIWTPQLKWVGFSQWIAEQIESGEVEVFFLTLPSSCLLLRLWCPVIHELNARKIILKAFRPVLRECRGVLHLTREGKEV